MRPPFGRIAGAALAITLAATAPACSGGDAPEERAEEGALEGDEVASTTEAITEACKKVYVDNVSIDHAAGSDSSTLISRIHYTIKNPSKTACPGVELHVEISTTGSIGNTGATYYESRLTTDMPARWRRDGYVDPNFNTQTAVTRYTKFSASEDPGPFRVDIYYVYQGFGDRQYMALVAGDWLYERRRAEAR